MKNRNEEKIKNIKELENTKNKYKKIRNIVLIILLIVFVLASIYYVRKYIVLSKVLRANYAVDLGKNYKITEYTNGDMERPTITYYKDGVFKTGTFFKDGYCSYFYLTEDEKYFIYNDMWDGEEHKSYERIKVSENYDPEKVFLFGFQFLLSEPREITTKDILNYTFTVNVKIGKEEYRGKEYITLQNGTEKLFANPETYYIEKQLYQGQVDERIIEQGVVTNETELPDLSTYVDETGF